MTYEILHALIIKVKTRRKIEINDTYVDSLEVYRSELQKQHKADFVLLSYNTKK